MDSTTNISSGFGVRGIERVAASVPVRIESNVSQSSGLSVPGKNHVVQSTKELKQAELSGTSFSLGEQQLIKVIERANKALQGANTSFRFSIHEGTKEIMVKVLNEDSGEVIREIPSEKILDMVAKMWEMAGILIDEKR